MDGLPIYDVDLFADEVLRDPYPHYQAMRDLGPLVWLPRHELSAAVHFEAVRDVLRNDEVFISGEGVAVNLALNDGSVQNTLMSDGDLHRRLKTVVGAPISPPNIDELTQSIREMADQLVMSLLDQGEFDGLVDFAQRLPVDIVSHLVGIPEAGRERMLDWSKATFNIIGAFNERGLADADVAFEIVPFAMSLERSDLRPGSWGAQVFEAVDRGDVEQEHVPGMLIDYIGPALDTTLNGIAHMLHLLGTHPEQWAMVREDPEQNVSRAVEEVLRHETVIRGFTRLATSDVEVSGVGIEAGQRVWALLSSANRDERRFDDPDSFDITRSRNTHVGFGAGPHLCVGVHLARLEMRSLLQAMAQHVETIEIGETHVALHNMLRGFGVLRATFTAG